MKKFFKKLDKILGILLIICAVAGVIYVGFIDQDALKPSYTVTLNSNGAVISEDSFTVKKGKTITLPEPTKEGYVFDGWYNGDSKWTTEDTITEDTILTAKWIPTQHVITFIVEGVEYEQACDYDSLPEFNTTPTKTPTISTEYSFAGWTPTPSIVTGPATYTATFTENIRNYNISISTNYPDGGKITGAGKYQYNSSATIELNVNTGYAFLGWYNNGSFYSHDTTLQFEDIAQDMNLEAQFAIIKKSITYINTHGTNPNPTSYDISFGTFNLLPLLRNGYNFIGWFSGPDGTGDKFTQIDSSKLLDYTLYAHYELETYTITYILNGGEVSTENPSTYHITDDTFTLTNPTKDDYTFLGWSGTGLSSTTKTVTIPNGSYGNKTYTANWQPLYVKITLNVDGKELNDDTISIPRGTILSHPSINSAKYGMSGYLVNNWYTDPGFSILFDSSSPVKSSLTLYGKWSYLIENGFYDYKTRFDNAISSQELVLSGTEGEDVIVKWIEYVAFYQINSEQTCKIKFTGDYNITADDENSLKTKVNNIITKQTFPSEFNIGYSYSQGATYTLTKLYCATDDEIENATLISDPEKTSTLTQLDYAFLKSVSGRSETFDNFNIKNVPNSLTVTTSNQLVYALEKGLNPICITGSSAENIYNKAKTVLRSIITDDMTDIQKTRAIYDWLIQNVSYDHYAANTKTISNNWENYDSWYAEGVFNSNKAVCDGYAKAFLIMAKIENIPTIRVTGNNHAWNKVYINGSWYGVDATHGDVAMSDYELHTYTSFMFTDEAKSANGYTSTDYQAIVANTNYNYYANEQYTINSTVVDLQINSISEFNTLMSSLASFTFSSPLFVVEIAIESSFYTSLSDSFGDKIYSLYFNQDKSYSFNLSSYSNLGTNSFGDTIYTLLLN